MENVNTANMMKEAKFDLHELFFSITKSDSTIVAGNDTFIRLSGYEKDEIIGRFHNIVRHQDMPRVIFKIFWDYIKSNRPVVAYVKNRTKDGSYYWVLAVVFPFGDEYISIRIKPNTQYFTLVKEIYSKLKAEEAVLSLNESEEALIKLLKDHGFKSYDHFMNDVLLAELLERKQLLLKTEIGSEQNIQNVPYTFTNMKPLYDISTSLLSEYGEWFEKIESFDRVKSAFEEKGLVLRMLARDIVFLSLNASVASYKLDMNGETFGVLASDVRTNAKENDILIGNIHEASQNISESLHEIIFLVSYVRLQMEMMTYFINEMLHDQDGRLNLSIDTIYELVAKYNEDLMKLPMSFEKAIEKNMQFLDELDRQVMYLGYVQIYGIIESARCNDDTLGFGEIFSQLKNLIIKTSDEIVLMKKMAEGFYEDTQRLIERSKGIKSMIQHMRCEIDKLKN